EIGKQLFNGPAGCGACHSGPLLTNKSMVAGKTNGMLTDVPSLIGVYDTAPYGRKGTWKDIDDMVAYAVQFTGAVLTAEELAALTSYVRQIPGDALYLNSASPLNGDNHVWVESPIELMFSQVLVPGQEDHFTIEALPEEGTPTAVPGAWTQSGRVVRFTPTETLEEGMDYRIRATEGLAATLGQVLYLPIEIAFRTGVPPLTDVSGKWAVTITATEPISGTLNGEMAFLQSKGGKIAGVVLTEFDQASLSHVEGIVSGMTLVLTPFILDVDLGGSPLQVQLESGYADLVDSDGDGFAESGVGEIGALGYTAAFTVVRTSLPESD
ncbi:MAG: Ig-like domain-containing protein, partial [Myxococcales bacterium]|nr:Ig-like domain-containing protein [Myxococcales bacterium]